MPSNAAWGLRDAKFSHTTLHGGVGGMTGGTHWDGEDLADPRGAARHGQTVGAAWTCTILLVLLKMATF